MRPGLGGALHSYRPFPANVQRLVGSGSIYRDRASQPVIQITQKTRTVDSLYINQKVNSSANPLTGDPLFPVACLELYASVPDGSPKVEATHSTKGTPLPGIPLPGPRILDGAKT